MSRGECGPAGATPRGAAAPGMAGGRRRVTGNLAGMRPRSCDAFALVLAGLVAGHAAAFAPAVVHGQEPRRGERSAADPPPVVATSAAVPVPPPSVTAVPAAPSSRRPPDPAATTATELAMRALEPLDPGPGGPTAAADRRTAPPPLAALYARPLPLVEALERSGDRARRLWISQAYWKVSAAFAAVRFGTESLERLELVAPGGDPHDRAVLDVAAAAARADLADARARLVAAQQDLVDLARLPPADPLPWPVDRPLAGPYQTHFETIFAARQATGRIRAIVRMLPAKHEALEARGVAAVAAARALDMAEADHAKGNRPIEAVVAAHAALVAQQREFIRSLEAYNLDIAEYAMAVADAAVPDDRFVSMLIGTPIQWRPQPPEAGSGQPPAVLPPAAAATPIPRSPDAADPAAGAAAE